MYSVVVFLTTMPMVLVSSSPLPEPDVLPEAEPPELVLVSPDQPDNTDSAMDAAKKTASIFFLIPKFLHLAFIWKPEQGRSHPMI